MPVSGQKLCYLPVLTADSDRIAAGGLTIASLFWQFVQPSRSAVATIEMIVELIDSVQLPHRRWNINLYEIICF